VDFLPLLSKALTEFLRDVLMDFSGLRAGVLSAFLTVDFDKFGSTF
jgi:hypothetical protein